MRYQEYGKKEISAVSFLMTLLFVVPFVNAYFQPSFYQNGDKQRNLASTNALLQMDHQQILRDIAGRNDAILSMVGKKPSQMEQFQFGVLSGRYNVTRSQGGISKLDIQHGLERRSLKKIEDKVAFLREYRSLWFIPFQYVERVIEVKIGDKNSEVFVLKNADKQSVGKATILSDKNGGMISLNLRSFSY